MLTFCGRVVNWEMIYELKTFTKTMKVCTYILGVQSIFYA